MTYDTLQSLWFLACCSFLWCIYSKKSDHLLLPWLSKTEVIDPCNAVFNVFWVPSSLCFCLPKCIILSSLIWSIYCFTGIKKKKRKKHTKENPWRSDSVLFFPSQKYTAIGLLGRATDTLDATGKVTEEKPYGNHRQIDMLDVIWRHKRTMS